MKIEELQDMQVIQCFTLEEYNRISSYFKDNELVSKPIPPATEVMWPQASTTLFHPQTKATMTARFALRYGYHPIDSLNININ